MSDSQLEFGGWQRQFLQDLFHKLGQPITALHGAVELALRKTMSASEHREVLKQALSLTTRLIEIIKTERELAESTDPGNVRTFDLLALVRTILEEFHAVFADSGITIFFQHQGPTQLQADPARISQALFLVLDSSVQSNRDSHKQLLLWLGNIGTEAVMYFGPTFCGTFGHKRAIYRPAAPPRRVLINLVKTAGGHIQILQTSESAWFLLSFPACRPVDNVSAALAANFS